jgi:hypothetical protein
MFSTKNKKICGNNKIFNHVSSNRKSEKSNISNNGIKLHKIILMYVV